MPIVPDMLNFKLVKNCTIYVYCVMEFSAGDPDPNSKPF